MSGALTLIATPIGNLGDLSDRARAALAECDVLFCEDTRRTRELLSAEGISAGRRLRSLHQHNERAMVDAVLDAVRSGRTVGLVTDAGTPTVSDPGAKVVAAVAQAGLSVVAVPGPSAVVTALSLSGFDGDRWCFEGFFPRGRREGAERIEAWRTEPRTVVFFESPQRVGATLRAMAPALGERRAMVGRELTKRFEECRRGTVAALADELSEPVRGEVVVVLEGAPRPGPADDDAVAAAVGRALAAGSTVRDAAAAAATELGVSRRRAYDIALQRQRGGG